MNHGQCDGLLVGFDLLKEPITENVGGRHGNVKPENFQQ